MRTLLLVALILAGCTTVVGSAAAPAPAAIELTDCHYMESLNLVPGALVDPFVPADFSVSAAPNLVVGMATCEATTSDGRTDTVTFGWADVSVSPRSALRTPGIGLYLYRIEHITADDLYGELHRAVGAECRVMDDARVAVDLAGSRAKATHEGASVWDIIVPLSTPVDGAGSRTPYREYGPAVGGYAYLQGDLVDPGASATPGTFTVDETSPLASVWGPAWPSRVQTARGFAIEGTTIGFVPAASAPAPRETC